jgi:hypothetical protein
MRFQRLIIAHQPMRELPQQLELLWLVPLWQLLPQRVLQRRPRLQLELQQVPRQLMFQQLEPLLLRQLVPPQQEHLELFDQFPQFEQLFDHHHLQKDPLILQR